jgi:serine/threonine protein phosphatase 1
MRLKKFSANATGRDFIVGDIHGCFDRLQALLDEAGFNPEADRLFTVGDMVDRGPDSLAAMEWLDRPWFFSVRGNHEQMAINFANGHNHAFHYERNGGRWFINLPDDEQRRIASRFSELPLAIELDADGLRVGIVHAEVPRNNWRSFDTDRKEYEEIALWSRERIEGMDEAEVEGIDEVFVGHTPLKDVVQLGNVTYLDTGAVFGHRLTLLCLTEGTVWQDEVRQAA